MYYLPTTFLFLYCSFMIYSVFLIDLYYRLTFGVVNLFFFFFFFTTTQSPYLQNILRLYISHYEILSVNIIAFRLWCFFNFVPTIYTKISIIMKYLGIIITLTAFTIHIITHSQKENYPFYVKILTWPCHLENFISSTFGSSR